MVSRYLRRQSIAKVVVRYFCCLHWGNATGISLASYGTNISASYKIAVELFIGLVVLSIVIVAPAGGIMPNPPKKKPHRTPGRRRRMRLHDPSLCDETNRENEVSQAVNEHSLVGVRLIVVPGKCTMGTSIDRRDAHLFSETGERRVVEIFS